MIGSVTLVVVLLAAPGPAPGESAEARAEFERAMTEITQGVPDLVVTSRFRSEQDQVRLAALGYAPHPHSQHRLGLAWDCAASPQSLEILRRRALARGFTALRLSSPLTGAPYLHVQRYAHSPLGTGARRLLALAGTQPDPAGLESVPATGHGDDPVVGPALPDEVDAGEILQAPRLAAAASLEFPRELRRRKAHGEIVLLLELSERGEVLDARVDSSTLPRFDDFVVGAVRTWRFTPASRQGRPVQVQARLAIPITIR
jgi:TonB family protein